MTRHFDEKRRESTKKRDALVLDCYERLMAKLGDAASSVSRSYIYAQIEKETGLKPRTIQAILNHAQ